MGFTFSHPALILPFRYLPKKSYSLNGLVIGSMIPDLEYFIHLDNASTHSHRLLGLFWFDLPMAIIVSIVFHQLIRNVLLQNLPLFLYQRFYRFIKFNWIDHLKKNWIVVCYSIIIGTLTHFLWDSFTGQDGYFVSHNSFLMMQLHYGNINVYLFQIIKYSSSLIGLLLVIYTVLKLPKNELVKNNSNMLYWIVIASLSILFIILRLLIQDNDERTLTVLIKIAISSGLFAMILSSLYQKYGLKFRSLNANNHQN